MVWRDLRLRALLDSPDAFGMTYEVESQRDDGAWRTRVDTNVADPFATNLIAEIDAKPVAIAVCVFDETNRSLCHLFAMWVDPRFRKRGAARALVTSALDWMKRQGAKEAQLSVTEGNEAALSLYSSCGFVDTGLREPLREGSQLRTIQMRRDLGDL